MQFKIDPRRGAAMAFDIAVLFGAWIFCFGLTSGFSNLATSGASLIVSTAAVVLTFFSIFTVIGLYGGIWRYASLHDLKQIGMSSRNSDFRGTGFLSLL